MSNTNTPRFVFSHLKLILKWGVYFHLKFPLSLFVSYTSCCWISLSRYSSGSWLVTAIVNLTRRADNGRINSSPVSRSPAIVRWQEGCPQYLRIPAEDPDGDVVKCPWATYSESRKYPDSFPYGNLEEVHVIGPFTLFIFFFLFLFLNCWTLWNSYHLSKWVSLCVITWFASLLPKAFVWLTL